jgi:glycosyltransferase involved in cell wall biosynthesis
MNLSKTKTKIAILSPIFSSTGAHGGITPVVWNLAESFARRGLEVDLLYRPPHGSPPQIPPLPGGVKTLGLGARHKITTAAAVIRYLRGTGPDILLSVGHRFNVAAITAKMLLPKTRVYLMVQNTMSLEASKKGPVHYWKRLQTISLLYRHADGIMAASNGVAEDLIETTRVKPSRVTTIYNPIVTPALIKRAKETFDHPWFAPGHMPVILGVGRLAGQKAFPVLIKAFAEVRKKYPSKLLILGEGPERHELENLIKSLELGNDVSLPGFEENPVKYMSKASVFVLSSDYEGFGNVVVEALASGIPVVSTDCISGPGEILDKGRYGRLVPVGDWRAMSEAIIETLERPPSPSLLEAAVKRFEIDTIGSQYLRFLGLDDF